MDKTASQIADAVLQKIAFSVTEEGHKYDADMAQLQKEHALNVARRMQESNTMGAYNEGGKNDASFLKALRYALSSSTGLDSHPVSEARHQAYVQRQHEQGSNAWNPFGGMLTPLPEEGTRGTSGLFSRLGKIAPKEEPPSGKTASLIAERVLPKLQ